VFAIALTLLIIDIKVPSSESIHSTADLWLALKYIAPSIYAFLLSFTIIFIAWVNHHNGLKLIHRSSASFIYANGFLLVTVVVMPFPTALMGTYLLTDHSAPAVILYNVVLAFQAIGWILSTGAAMKNNLGKNEKSTLAIREQHKYGYFAFTAYSLCAITAFWFPLAIAIITTITWIFWLIMGINLKEE
jgi:uncharacterized membrane protein